MSRVERWLLVGTAVVATGALASGLGRTDLWPPDEARVAEIAREMAANGNWVLPRLNGRPFIEEPPLFYWLQAGAYRLAGDASTAAARLPSAAAAIVGTLVTAAVALRLGARPLFAVLVLTTAPEYWWMARSATPDTAAAAATALALGLFFVAWQSGRRGLLAAAVGAVGVAFGCKSFLPVALAVLTMLAFVVCAGWGRLRARELVLAVTVVTGFMAVWILAVAREVGAESVTFFVITNHLGRFMGDPDEGHVRSVLYYLPNLALGLLPWSAVLPAAVAAAWRERATPARLFPLLWAGGMTAALTLSASKRAHYLLPAYPAFAVLVAQWWPEAWRGRVDRTVVRLMIVLLLIAGPVLTLVLLGTRPIDLLVMANVARRAPAAWNVLPRNLLPTGSAWLAASVLAMLGLVVVRADRGRNPAGAAASLAAYLTAIHLLLTLVILPNLNPLCTARPWAERLGRVADGGVPVVAFGFPDGDALSPFMFYARRQFLELRDARLLVAQLQARPACALMREQDYAALASVLPGLPVPDGTLNPLRFVVVETAQGLCRTEPTAVGTPAVVSVRSTCHDPALDRLAVRRNHGSECPERHTLLRITSPGQATVQHSDEAPQPGGPS